MTMADQNMSDLFGPRGGWYWNNPKMRGLSQFLAKFVGFYR